MIAGIEELCEACAARVRAGSTAAPGRSEHRLEKFLAKQLSLSADWIEPNPRLVGSVTTTEAAAMDDDEAWSRVRRMRWPDTGGQPRCPKCGSQSAYVITKRRKFCCNSCRLHFSAVSGTAFASFKGGYAKLLQRIAYEGTIDGQAVMSAKTALDMRRRKTANRG